MKELLKKTILFLSFAVNSYTSIGQNNVLRLDQITTKDGLPQNSVQAILQDKYGFIWFSSFSGLYKYDGYEFTDYHPNPEDPNALLSRGVYNLVSDSLQNIYVTFFDTTFVCKYNYDSDNFERLHRYTLDQNVINKITRRRKTAVKSFDTKDYYWEYSNKLLTRRNKTTNKIFKFCIEPPQNQTLTNDVIACMFVDKHENLWLGTENQGIYKVNTNSKPFFSYYNNINECNVLIKDIIRAITVDNQDKIWIGTFYNGIYIYDRLNNSIISMRRNPNNPQNTLVSDEIRSILCDSKGFVWIGTKGGLSKYNPVNETFTNFDTLSSNYIPHNWIHSIMEDHNGTIWIGSFDGIARYDEKAEQFISYKPNIMFTNNQVDALFEDSKYNIWVATQNGGITCLKRKENPLQFNPVYYNNSKDDKNTLSSNRVFSIIEGPDGFMWIATEYGLNRLTPKTGDFKHFIKKSGLPDDMIMGLLFDNQHNLWISHKKGLSRMDTKTFSFRNYSEQDGLQSNEFSENTCFRDPKTGELYFGGSNGINSFYPEQIVENSALPEIVFTGLEVLNQQMVINKEINGRILMTKPLLFTKEITLTYSDKSFSIKFAALHYANPKSNKFKYKLEGYNNDWISTDASVRFASYSNLPAGTYKFKVMASNNDGVWNEKPAAIIINILPPWWNNWIAYTIYFLIVTLILYLVYNYIVQKEKFKNQIRYEQMKSKKIMELDEMKLQFFTNISHEFRTPLSLILDPLRKLNNEEIPQHQAKYYFEMILHNAQTLLQMINQLLDFRKIEKGHIKIDICQEDIVAFTKHIFDTFNLNAGQKNIKYRFYASPQTIIARFDKEKVEKILNNLLSNAFKYTNDNDEISLKIYISKPASADVEENGYVVISIKDTGVGISTRDQKKIFDRFFQAKTLGALQNQGTGIGLAYTKQLVDILKGKITVKSDIGLGSIFKVKLPIGKIDDSAIQFNSKSDFEEEVYISPLKTEKEDAKSIDDNGNEEKLLILIVEDNIDVRNYLKHELSGNYRVEEATNGLNGIDATLKHFPDIILSDIMMPGLDGLEFCKTIKADERTSHIPFVLLTAKKSDEYKKEGYEFGADAYITKPFNTEVLKAIIFNLIESRKKLKEIFTKSPFIDIKKIAGNGADERFLKCAIETVEDELANSDFNIDNLSDKLRMSRRQLTHKVKTLTGQTVHDFIKTIRLNKGAKLLLAKEYNISEVSYMLGYNAPANFSRSFTKQFGKNPSEYIDAINKNSD